MMVDFSKAFDVIDVTFIKKCLSKFNFGPVFQKWVTMLYTNIASSVIVNGWLSETFNVQTVLEEREKKEKKKKKKPFLYACKF